MKTLAFLRNVLILGAILFVAYQLLHVLLVVAGMAT